ncbi:uncharacterized protein LOC111023601 [Momordica charantia]|uniref:Uncharacterized protein LOC111023601 n=1 Tax=Momordica charantia TaxID=3673 RepID=A0A6J1DR94_MOMCH|nr:uncharacterized protein LOC111023601 [Momordica charantia]
MAKAAKPASVLLLLLTLIIVVAVQGFTTGEDELLLAKALPPQFSSVSTMANQGKNKMLRNSRTRRLMIGSTAPTCTYNECRGCKYKCRAEQVPVEGNDPINSAYHYRCVCHRFQ